MSFQRERPADRERAENKVEVSGNNLGMRCARTPCMIVMPPTWPGGNAADHGSSTLTIPIT
jgi:hypothetical protein